MFRYLALAVVAVVVTAAAWLARPDGDFLERQWLRSRLEPIAKSWLETTTKGPLVVAVASADDLELPARLGEAVKLDGLIWQPALSADDPADHRLSVRTERSPHSVTLYYALDGQPEVVRRVAWYAVLPPLLAVVTAILLRRVVLCLVIGVVAGGMIAMSPTPAGVWAGPWYAFNSYFLHHAVLDSFRIEIISFVLLISATVGLAQQSGGIHAGIGLITRFCRTARSARLAAAGSGLLLFFDDYMNCIIVGNALRPLTDRYRVSREKLAYIVDSTAAPVAGLALVSTWIAFEMTQIGEGLLAAGITEAPYEVFVRTLPYRFYCWFTLALVLLLAYTGRDYGPMLAAERRALREGPPRDDDIDAGTLYTSSAGRPTDAAAPAETRLPLREPAATGAEHPTAAHPSRRAWVAILPIGVTLACIAAGLGWSGTRAGPPIEAVGPLDYLRQLLGRADSAWAFSRASGIGYAAALAMVVGGRIMTWRQALRGSFQAIRVILIAVVILLLAWSIGAACRDVGTADMLVAMFYQVLHPLAFSLVVFGLACLISFATGTSYGTMAILLPNVVPLAMAVGVHHPAGPMTLVILSIGAVLEGAIFGDHCSPISDTTILSAIASRCDPLAHVRTQMPYALTGLVAATLCGYAPAALGVPAWICYAVGLTVLLITVRLLGRRIEAGAAVDFSRVGP